jgi:hypothetical protein
VDPFRHRDVGAVYPDLSHGIGQNCSSLFEGQVLPATGRRVVAAYGQPSRGASAL